MRSRFNTYGMHFIHWNHYGQYDDLDVYDRIEREKQAKLRRQQKQVGIIKQQEPIKPEDSKAKEVSNQKDLKKETQNRKNKQSGKNNSNMLRAPYPAGKFEVIPNSYYIYTSLIRMNIFLIGLKKKIDIVETICECSKIIIKDMHVNPKADTENDEFAITLPKTEHAFIYLLMLSQKLNVKINDLFSFNKKSIENDLYNLLKELKDCMWEYFYTKNPDYEAFELYLSWDDLLSKLRIDSGKTVFEYRSASPRMHDPSLIVCKHIKSNGNTVYVLEIGDLGVSGYTQFDYMFPGADVVYEKENLVTKIIDELVDYHKDDFNLDDDEDYYEFDDYENYEDYVDFGTIEI